MRQFLPRIVDAPDNFQLGLAPGSVRNRYAVSGAGGEPCPRDACDPGSALGCDGRYDQ